MPDTLVAAAFCSKEFIVMFDYKYGNSINNLKISRHRGFNEITSPSTAFSGFAIFGVPRKKIDIEVEVEVS